MGSEHTYGTSAPQLSAEVASYNPATMLFKIALMLWLAAFLIGLFASPKQRTLMGKLVFGGFCLLLLAALIRILRI